MHGRLIRSLLGPCLGPAALAAPLPHPFVMSGLDGANGYIFQGIDQDDLAAVAVAGAGDVDGDGFEDFLAGARLADPGGRSQAGEAYLLFGQEGASASPLALSSLAESRGVRFEGVAVDDLAGISISGLGDFDGDGLDDLAVGAVYFDPPGRLDAGAVHLIYGTPSGFGAGGVLPLASLDGLTGVTLLGASEEDGAAQSLSGLGDLNGDGRNDLLIGAPMERRAGEGLAAVVFGAPSLGGGGTFDTATLDGSNGFTLRGLAPGDLFGQRAQGAGDVNGDGHADLVVGALFADPGGLTDAGEVFVIYGGPATGVSGEVDLSSLDGTDGVRIPGLVAGGLLGSGASAAGDVNGDGYGDLILAAPFASPLGRALAGEAYLIFGGPGGLGTGPTFDLATLDGSNGLRLAGRAAGDAAGVVATAAGDVNGDGLSDVLVGAQLADPRGVADAGEAHLIYGTAGPLGTGGLLDLQALDGVIGTRLEGIDPGEWFAESLSCAGDVNSDGLHDLVFGAPLADQGPLRDPGEGYLVLGAGASASGTSRAFLRAGAAPAAGIGLPGTGTTGQPATRATVGFDAGTGPHTAGASLVTVTLTRSDAAITGLGNGLLTDVADVRWEITTDRTGWSQAEVTLIYTAAETALSGTALELYQAPAPGGPWTLVATQSHDPARRRITATVSSLGHFALLGEGPTAAENWPSLR